MTQTLLRPALHPARRPAAALPQASIDVILQHSKHLAPPDRVLIEGVYLRGLSAAELSRALGREPTVVRRRLARIIRRMSTPLFKYVARNSRTWAMERAAIAEAVVLRGLSQRAAATMLGVGIHRVRREIDRISALVDDQQPRHQSL